MIVPIPVAFVILILGYFTVCANICLDLQTGKHPRNDAFWGAWLLTFLAAVAMVVAVIVWESA